MQHESVIFVVISVLVVALVCGSFTSVTPFIVFAERPAPGWWSSTDCGSWGGGTGVRATWCCWYENGVKYCQTCVPITEGPDKGEQECTTKEKQSLEQPPTPQPFDPTAPLQDGVLEQPPTFSPFNPTAPLQGGVLEQQDQQTPPSSAPGASPGLLEQLEQGEGFSPGFLQRQQEQPPVDQGAAQLPPATEGSQPATVGEEPPGPVCQEGLEFNEDLGFCVPAECPEGQELNEETGICVLEEEQPATAEEPEEQQQQTEEEQSSEESGSEEENGNN